MRFRGLEAHFGSGEILYKISDTKRQPIRKRVLLLAAAMRGSSIRKECIFLEIAQFEIVRCWWVMILHDFISRRENLMDTKKIPLAIHKKKKELMFRVRRRIEIGEMLLG
jgi:hypothetical protein